MANLTGRCAGCLVHGPFVGNRIIGCRCRTVGAPQTNARASTPGKPSGGVPTRARGRGRGRAGRAAADALVAALTESGFPPVGALAPETWVLPTVILVREYAWALDVGRDFRADLAFPALRLLVEVKGGAHAAGRAKQRADVEREALAVSLGYRLLPLTPDQARSNDGVGLVLMTRDVALAALAGTLRSPAGGAR